MIRQALCAPTDYESPFQQPRWPLGGCHPAFFIEFRTEGADEIEPALATLEDAPPAR